MGKKPTDEEHWKCYDLGYDIGYKGKSDTKPKKCQGALKDSYLHGMMEGEGVRNMEKREKRKSM